MMDKLKIQGNHHASTWQGRHNDAIERARLSTDMGAPVRRMERAVARMVSSLMDYADAHADLYESPVSDDYVLDPEVQVIARALRVLLNGETGRLDCGTLDALLLPMAEPDEEQGSHNTDAEEH